MFRRNWEQPVKRPHAANMNSGEQAGTDDRKNRHRFSCSVNTGSPVLTKQEQNRANQSSRVANADPENEVNNWPTPIGGVVVTPNAHSLEKQVSDASSQDH